MRMIRGCLDTRLIASQHKQLLYVGWCFTDGFA
ncbi:hypothetical protein GQ607_004276 [Colletotrichum asianum]|uniref:Uncharacterized protein n=1 Tax=Colletotrichum asianum TaxID=702518 RepID=A0A8H3ZXM1_9PEZI|nr:hypothetical protein GQ607_004276 [Colletotrichum asianum]